MAIAQLEGVLVRSWASLLFLASRCSIPPMQVQTAELEIHGFRPARTELLYSGAEADGSALFYSLDNFVSPLQGRKHYTEYTRACHLVLTNHIGPCSFLPMRLLRIGNGAVLDARQLTLLHGLHRR